MAELGRGVPRRHSLFLDHFGDHLGPPDDLLVSVHGERTNLTIAMTLQTMFLQYRRHFATVRDLGIGLRFEQTTNVTAKRLGARH